MIHTFRNSEVDTLVEIAQVIRGIVAFFVAILMLRIFYPVFDIILSLDGWSPIMLVVSTLIMYIGVFIVIYLSIGAFFNMRSDFWGDTTRRGEI